MYIFFSKLDSDIEFIYLSSSWTEGLILNDVPSPLDIVSGLVARNNPGGAFSVLWSEANPSMVIFLLRKHFLIMMNEMTIMKIIIANNVDPNIFPTKLFFFCISFKWYFFFMSTMSIGFR